MPTLTLSSSCNDNMTNANNTHNHTLTLASSAIVTGPTRAPPVPDKSWPLRLSRIQSMGLRQYKQNME